MKDIYEDEDNALGGYTPYFKPSASDAKFETDFKCELVTSIDRFLELTKEVEGKIVAIDSETTGLDMYAPNPVVGVSWSTNAYNGFYVPLRHRIGKNINDVPQFFKLWEAFLKRNNLLFYNAPFDLMMFRAEGIDTRSLKTFEVMSLVFGMDSNVKDNGLKDSALYYLGRKSPHFEDVLGKKSISFDMLDPQEAFSYASQDTCNTYALYQKLIPQGKSEFPLTLKIDNRLSKYMPDLLDSKITINNKAMMQMGDEIREEIINLERQIFKEVGHVFVLNSRRQLSKTLQELGLNTGVFTKTGDMKTDEKSLKALNSPICDKIVKRNSLVKQLSSYVEKFSNVSSGRVNYHLFRVPCLTESATLITSSGFKSIKDVVKGESIWTMEGWDKVVDQKCVGPSEVFTLKMSNGATLIGTGHHPVMLQNGNTTELQYLQKGMVLCPPPSTPLLNPCTLSDEEKDLAMFLGNTFASFWTVRGRTFIPASVATGEVDFPPLTKSINADFDSLVKPLKPQQMFQFLLSFYETLCTHPDKPFTTNWDPNFYSRITWALTSLGINIPVWNPNAPHNESFLEEFEVCHYELLAFQRKDLFVYRNAAYGYEFLAKFIGLSDHLRQARGLLLVESLAKQDSFEVVYDITMEKCPWFSANGILTHNTGRLASGNRNSPAFLQLNYQNLTKPHSAIYRATQSDEPGSILGWKFEKVGKSQMVEGEKYVEGMDPHLNIRRAITVPSDDFIFAAPDYKQEELAIAANLSRDPVMLPAFINHDDLHKRVACFGKETEFLTPTGWKTFDSISEDEMIAQWVGNRPEFVLPQSRINYPVQSEVMVSVKLPSGDLLMTKDHRCLVSTGGEPRFVEAGSLKRLGTFRFVDDISGVNPATLINGVRPKSHFIFSQHEVMSMNTLLLVAASYVREGFTSGKSVFIRGKNSLIESLYELLKSEHINVELEKKDSTFRMDIYESYLHDFLRDSVGTDSVLMNKPFPKFLYNLGYHDARVFLSAYFLKPNSYFDEVMEGNGSIELLKLPTASKSWIDGIQFLLGRIGIWTKISGSDLYWRRGHHTGIKLNPTKVSEVTYSGNVSCFTVPSGALLVRAGNTVTVQGNCQMFGEENYSAEKRKKAKICSFGLLYGGSGRTLANVTGLPLDECDELARKFWETMKVLAQWKRQKVSETYQKGGVCYTAFGRPRRLAHYLTSPVPRLRQFGERSVASHLIQGLAGDVIRIALANYFEKVQLQNPGKIYFIGTIHDELSLAVRKDSIHLIDDVINVMQMKPPGFVVPLEVSVEFGHSYGELFEFEKDANGNWTPIFI